MSSLIPVVAISPILLYIGMLIGAQAFQETPKSHAPAIVLALMPHLAAWGKLQIDNTLAAAGTNAAAVGFDKLGGKGRPLPGAVDPGRRRRSSAASCWARSRSFIIDRKFAKASAFALVGAVLTFFGFMHGEAIGFGQTPVVAVATWRSPRCCSSARACPCSRRRRRARRGARGAGARGIASARAVRGTTGACSKPTGEARPAISISTWRR